MALPLAAAGFAAISAGLKPLESLKGIYRLKRWWHHSRSRLWSRFTLHWRQRQSRGAGTYHKHNVWWFAWRKNFLSSHIVENSVPFKRSAFSEFSMLAFRQKIFLANHLSEALVRFCSSTESSLESHSHSNCNFTIAFPWRNMGGVLYLIAYRWISVTE